MAYANLIPVVYLLFLHWVGDFVCQTHRMSQLKSKSWLVLGDHVTTYTAVVTLGVLGPLCLFSVLTGNTLPVTPNIAGFYTIFFAIVFIPHFIVDAITSRMTARRWREERWHDFFVVLGFDQLIHATCLVATFWFLFLR